MSFRHWPGCTGGAECDCPSEFFDTDNEIKPKILLNISIPGEPVAQERHRWGRNHNYDPNAKDKKTFQWLVKATCPALKPTASRLGLLIHIWTKKRPMKTRGDYDNYAKFIGDAMNGIIWEDDSQIDDGRVVVHHSALEPRVEILVWEMESNENK